MKWKKIACGIAIVVIILIGACIWFLWKLGHIMGIYYMSPEEFGQLYEKHQELFDEVAEELSQYPDGIYIHARGDSSGRPDWVDYRGEGYRFSDTSGCGFEREKVLHMKEIPIDKLFKKTEIFRITKENGRIYFSQASNMSFSVGIAYSGDKDSDTADSNNYITEWEKIAPGWYYFKSE